MTHTPEAVEAATSVCVYLAGVTKANIPFEAHTEVRDLIDEVVRPLREENDGLSTTLEDQHDYIERLQRAVKKLFVEAGGVSLEEALSNLRGQPNAND